MTEIKIKDWDKHYTSPTKRHLYGIIWWANKMNRLNFAHKKDGKWVVNQQAFEEYYKKHGQMSVERVEPEKMENPSWGQYCTLREAQRKALADSYLADKAVVDSLAADVGNLTREFCNDRLGQAEEQVKAPIRMGKHLGKFIEPSERFDRLEKHLDDFMEDYAKHKLSNTHINQSFLQELANFDQKHKALADSYLADKAVVDSLAADVGNLTREFCNDRLDRAVTEAKQEKIEKKIKSIDSPWIMFWAAFVGGIISIPIYAYIAWLIWG